MRNISWIFVLLIGCSGSVAVRNEGSPNPPDVIPDGGSGGIGGENDGGLDGGAPDGGTDGGMPCINTVEQVPLEARSHIPEDSTPVYVNNPPVSGEHYAVWARWQIYTEVVPRGYWVHNLEHGGVVFLYRPDAPQSLVEALTVVYNAIPNDSPCEHPRALLLPDPLLDVSWAVTVSGPEDVGFGYRIKSDCIQSRQALIDFAVQRRNRAIEVICDDGLYPY